MDNFTIAVLVGGGIVVAVFVLMLVFDRKGPEPAAAPVATPVPSAKSSGKRKA